MNGWDEEGSGRGGEERKNEEKIGGLWPVFPIILGLSDPG